MADARPHGPADDHATHHQCTDAGAYLHATDRYAIVWSEQLAVGLAHDAGSDRVAKPGADTNPVDTPDDIGSKHRGADTGPHHVAVAVADAAAFSPPKHCASNFPPKHGPNSLAVGHAVHAASDRPAIGAAVIVAFRSNLGSNRSPDAATDPESDPWSKPGSNCWSHSVSEPAAELVSNLVAHSSPDDPGSNPVAERLANLTPDPRPVASAYHEPDASPKRDP